MRERFNQKDFENPEVWKGGVTWMVKLTCQAILSGKDVNPRSLVALVERQSLLTPTQLESIRQHLSALIRQEIDESARKPHRP